MIDLPAFRQAEFDRREANLLHACRQELHDGAIHGGALHIAYVMTHTGVCGGTKVILEHANHLVHSGHRVTLVCHFDKPDWFPMDERVAYVQIPFERELTLGIPDCDVVVATYWREIYECILRKKAPVVYFEQGDYHLFDWEHVSPREKAYIDTQYQCVPYIFTVSPGAAEQIRQVFHRSAHVIPNAVDATIFYQTAVVKKPLQQISIAMIGSEKNEFKRIGDILGAIGILANRGYDLELYWVSPDKPASPQGHLAINPPQQTIGDFLRNADFYVSASTYESFSLPVLEAMACGCAVVTTKNKGVLSYAKGGNNCLFVDMYSPNGIADAIEALHADARLRDRLIENGLETAKMFDWDAIVLKLIDYYRDISRFRP